ncbi:hypothetical protein AB0C18_35455 [Nonomuraea muscovyensis]|uniref:hypothetical protein n=1 Tax=Nonomuraea muscovyensis TaxID=1124761 RepID=UPI0034102799
MSANVAMSSHRFTSTVRPPALAAARPAAPGRGAAKDTDRAGAGRAPAMSLPRPRVAERAALLARSAA